MSVWTIVVAAGKGERFGGPKQLMALGGRRVVDHAVNAASANSDGVVLVVAADSIVGSAAIITVVGGATRADSVRAGLTVVPDAADIVLVHDAARPLAGDTLFQRVIAAVRGGADGAVPGVAIPDTVKEVRGDVIIRTVHRESLVIVQTPQAFKAAALRSAYATGAAGTDDSAVVEGAGGVVVVIAGDVDNFKITERADLARAEAVLSRRRSAP